MKNWKNMSNVLRKPVLAYEKNKVTKQPVTLLLAFWTVKHMGPVVQSIVSLTMSLRSQLLSLCLTTLSNRLLFFVGKM